MLFVALRDRLVGARNYGLSRERVTGIEPA